MKDEAQLQYARLEGAAVSAAVDRQPSAREIRARVPHEVRATSYSKGLGITARCVGGYAVALVLTAWPGAEAWPVRLLGSFMLGVMGAISFDVAHEALHVHFTGSRPLDRWIARFLLLPTLFPLGPTIYSHVHRHHRYTNVKDYDTQWSPLSPAEYFALSPARRLVERVYRSAAGLGLYWTFRVALPCLTPRGLHLSEKIRPRASDRAEYARDRVLVYAWIAANVVGWYAAAPALGISGPAAVLNGFLVPLMFAHWWFGTATYLQHTSEDLAWFESPEQTTFYGAQMAGTMTLLPTNKLFEVMLDTERPHGAHHVDIRIPAYGLKEARDLLDAAYPGVAPKRVVSLRGLIATTTRCKLYDFAKHQWLDFSGRPTSEPILRAQPAMSPAV